MVDSTIHKDKSCGIIPILYQNNTYQFLLIQHHAGHWGFPKGHPYPKESEKQAACREFSEETGIVDYTLLDTVSFSETYSFVRKGKKFEKTVIYFPALVQSTFVHCQEAEIQNHCWADYQAAMTLMTYEPSKRVLAQVNHYLSHFSLPNS